MEFGIHPNAFSPGELEIYKLLLPKMMAYRELQHRTMESELTPQKVHDITFILTEDPKEAARAQANYILQTTPKE